MRRLAYVLLPLTAACGEDTPRVRIDGGTSPSDARGDAYVDPFPCEGTDGGWPTIAPIAHGSLELGGGRGGFHALTDPYPLEWGVQDGAMFVVQLRMTGFPPGDERDFDSGPRTRIRAFFDETDVPLNRFANCGTRPPFIVNGNGSYDLLTEHLLAFETCWRADRLIGQRIRIEAEIFEDNGHYASATRVITADPPSNDYPMEQDTPECPPL